MGMRFIAEGAKAAAASRGYKEELGNAIADLTGDASRLCQAAMDLGIKVDARQVESPRLNGPA